MRDERSNSCQRPLRGVAVACRKRGHPSKWIRREKRHRIYARDRYTCTYCASSLHDPHAMTLEHVRARSRGGKNHHTNLVTVCRSCNSSKQDATLVAWCARTGRDIKTIRKRIRNAQRRRLPSTNAAPSLMGRDQGQDTAAFVADVGRPDERYEPAAHCG